VNSNVTFFDKSYRRGQEFAERHTMLVMLLFAGFFCLATIGLSQLRLDLSFRPLFASGHEIAEPTREFESVFGQSSGAWITAIVENASATTPTFFRSVSRMSDKVRSIPHVSEVSSITSVSSPQWEEGDISLINAIPRWLLEPEQQEKLELQIDSLLDGSRFVNWLVSADGSRLLVAARLDLPLDDLDGRREVIGEFKERIENEIVDGLEVQFTGVSVVELAYEEQVLRDQLIATTLTALVLTLLIYCGFRSLRAVIICLTPVSLAVPATLGLMGWMGQPVTIINTAIPAIIMVVGVADAVHMLTAWLESRGAGSSRLAATRTMMTVTGAACFFTTATTMGGFLSLLSADLVSVGGFGLSAAIGILIAWIANQVIVPIMARNINAGSSLPVSFLNTVVDKFINSLVSFAVTRPLRVIAIALVIAALCLAVIPSLKVDQRFNEELPESHPISRAQQVLETDFGGFLGPEISIRRVNGSSIIDNESLLTLDQFVSSLLTLADTRQVWSVQDLLIGHLTTSERAAALVDMRVNPAMSERVRELVNEDQNRLAVIVRIGDLGTHKANLYRDQIAQISQELWGSDYQVEVVGQWWLAQHGMRLLLKDMLTSLITALFIVLPMLWLVLRERRLFIAAAFANTLPLLAPLAFMAATGTVLRIGTVVVLAVALGIAVDNTLHIIIRLRSQLDSGGDVHQQIKNALQVTGRAVVFTTLALAGGFLSMMSNQLLAIRDMGMIATVAFIAAMLADLLVLPALYAIQTSWTKKT